MKKKLLFCAVFLAGSLSLLTAKEAKWLKGPDSSWFIRLESALAKARAEGKKVYVLKTGSDWCGWCVKLQNDVFNSSAFKRFAKEHLVLVYLDFPRRKNMPADQRTYNKRITQQLKLNGGYPSAVILDANGKILGKKSGYSAAAAYVQLLRNMINAPASQESASLASAPVVERKNRPYKKRRKDYAESTPDNTGSSLRKSAKKTADAPAPMPQPAPLPAPAPAPASSIQSNRLTSGWTAGPTGEWHVKLETALEEARRTNKKILAVKTGSDWSSHCGKLRSEVLTEQKFNSFARNNFVLLYLDLPDSNSMPAAQKRYNQSTANKIGASGVFPTTVILDCNGKFLSKVSGYASRSTYFSKIREAAK